MDPFVLLFFAQVLLLPARTDEVDWTARFEVPQPDARLAASCTLADSGMTLRSATLTSTQPPARHRSVVECALECWRNFKCDGFTFDKDRNACNAFVKTVNIIPCNLSKTFWRKQCGLRSQKSANVTACASRLLESLPDSAFSATSVHNGKGPQCAKLYNASANCHGYYGSWSPNTTTNESDFMQIDLPATTTVTGYDIKARVYGIVFFSPQWVTSFNILYSCDGQIFKPYGYNGTPTAFQGNSDVSSTFSSSFVDVITGVRSIRIQPIDYYIYKSMRIELYGC